MYYFARSGSVTRVLSGQTRRVTDPARARITLKTFGKHHWSRQHGGLHHKEDNLGASIPDSLAYPLLKALSHSKNLKTSNQIAKEAGQDMYAACEASSFLEYIGKYLDYKGKSVIDVGCGMGDLCIMLAKTGAQRVVGVDLSWDRIASARRKAVAENVQDRVTFECMNFVKEYQALDTFDIAFSQAAFEHILSPLDCLKKIYACLSEGGVLGTIFGPLWSSPYGAHMYGFTSVPWVHFLFPERVVLRVRTERFRPDDPVERYEDVEGHLNRITVQKFMQYATQAGFEVQAFRLNPSQDRGIYKIPNALVNAIPFLRELGSLQLLAVLKKPSLRRLVG